jgi:hypothetical protein
MAADANEAPPARVHKPQVTMTLGTLKITNTLVELRCEIRNDTSEDIWIYSEAHRIDDLNVARGTNAHLFVEEDRETLVILRRMDLPFNRQTDGGSNQATYVRLPAGRCRAESFVICLPVIFDSTFSLNVLNVRNAIDRGLEPASRLTFELGYFTTQDLDSVSKEGPDPVETIHPESPDSVKLFGSRRGRITKAERVVRMTVDGVSVAYGQWIHWDQSAQFPEPSETTPKILDSLKWLSLRLEHRFGFDYGYAERLLLIEPSYLTRSARQIVDLYTRLAEGELEGPDFNDRLDRIMSKRDREELLRELERKQALASVPKVELTPMEAMEDLFHDFRVDAEEYRFAQRLLAVDPEILRGNETARRIADTYERVARGEVDPAELAPRIKKILGKRDRDELRRELEKEGGGELGTATNGG